MILQDVVLLIANAKISCVHEVTKQKTKVLKINKSEEDKLIQIKRKLIWGHVIPVPNSIPERYRKPPLHKQLTKETQTCLIKLPLQAQFFFYTGHIDTTTYHKFSYK